MARAAAEDLGQGGVIGHQAAGLRVLRDPRARARQAVRGRELADLMPEGVARRAARDEQRVGLLPPDLVEGAAEAGARALSWHELDAELLGLRAKAPAGRRP